MSTDELPKTPSPPQPPCRQRRGDRQGSSQGRWFKRGLLAIGAAALVASAAAMIRGAGSSRQIGPRLTHTITRGDLIVTATEQGTLESSENTEIKCQVRGKGITIIWVIASGTTVKPGDELVRLETLVFEDRVSEMSKWSHLTRSAAERSQADVVSAELAISEYLEGRYPTELMTLEKDLAIAESNLRTARSMLAHSEMMAKRDYVSALVVEENTFAVTQSELSVEAMNTRIEVLKEHDKPMQLETLKGNLKAGKAQHEANKARVKQLQAQLVLCSADLEYCVVKAERSGLVIYPTAEPWKYVPEIQEGATVYMGQTMLLMPDLSKMQVKVGIREAIVALIKPGLAARITLPDKTLNGQVSSVASVAASASWQTGNEVMYDTIIELPSLKGLKPGTSAEVEVIIERYRDVLTIPVAAVLETAQGNFCWVKTSDVPKRHLIELADTNDLFTVVKAGLKEGDEVILNPLALAEAARMHALEPRDEAKPGEPDPTESAAKSKPPEPSAAKPSADSKKRKPKPQAGKRGKKKQTTKPQAAKPG